MRSRRAVLVAAALLALTGCGQRQAPHVPAPAPPPAVVRAYLTMDATDHQREQIRAWLGGRPEVASSLFESRDQALAAFKESFEDSPELVASIQVTDLPESFLVTLADRATLDVFVEAMQLLDGVESVAADAQGPPSPAPPG